MKHAYVIPKKWTHRKQEVFEKVKDVVEDFQSQGYKMTLRQLYYQLVSSAIIPNETKEYAKLSTLLTEARMYGYIDWDFIEDRIRVPKKHGEWDDIPDIVNSAIASYRRNRWIDQDNYLEVWVEKDALSGVLQPITEKYHVHLMVNRGYSSASAMHDASIRFKRQEQNGKETFILYLGDHDPSGMDMVRDIQERLETFGSTVEVKRIALNMEQIEQFSPPPNPAKITDPRAKKYIAEFGATSWELDALSPRDLNELLDSQIQALMDIEKYNHWCRLEEHEKQELVRLSNEIEVDEIDDEDLPKSDDEIV